MQHCKECTFSSVDLLLPDKFLGVVLLSQHVEIFKMFYLYVFIFNQLGSNESVLPQH